MKKIFILFLLLFITMNLTSTELYAVDIANTDYNSFSEIIMSKGKLVKNYTDEELIEYESNLPTAKMHGFHIYEVNHLVNATYISNTLYSFENRGNTDITYNLKIKVEKNNKVTYSSSLDTKTSFNGEIGKFKGELETKLGVEFSEANTKSDIKEEELELVVEAQSRAIVYLAGNLVISNGIAAFYFVGSLMGVYTYEVVTIVNQYVRIEKVAI